MTGIEREKPERKEDFAKIAEPVLKGGRDIEEGAAKRVGEFLGAVAPESYTNDFYLPLDPGQVIPMFENFDGDESGKEAGHNRKIDLRRFIPKDKPFSSEEVARLENYALYHFMLNDVTPEILRKYPDDHLKVLDVGSGPTIYQYILYSLLAGEIQPSDYEESNIEATAIWLSDPVGWESYSESLSVALKKCGGEISQIASPQVMERSANFSADWRSIDKYLQEIIKRPISVDVFNDDLTKMESEPDIVNVNGTELLTSFFCIESAYNSDPEKWRKGIKNICNKLNKDGFLVMSAITGAEWYKGENGKVVATKVDSKMIADELELNGFEIVKLTDLICETEEEAISGGRGQDYSGYSGMSLILARKK
jgi:hypothetical protein